MYFLHPTPPLWLLCGGLNLYYSPDSYRIRLARLWALFSDLVAILSFSLDQKKKSLEVGEVSCCGFSIICMSNFLH